MNKAFFFIFSFVLIMFAGQFGLQAQTVSYKVDGTTATQSLSELSTIGSLATATEISLSGDWSADDILIFKQAIKSSWSSNNSTQNAALKELNLSGITTLSGDFTGIAYDSPGFAYAFYNCTALTTVIMPQVAPSSAVALRYTYGNCSSLTTVDLVGFDNISNMSNAFYRSSKLTSLNLPTNNLFANGVSFGDAFQGCSALTSVDLSGFSKISGLSGAFQNCSKLTTVILPANNEYRDGVSLFGAFQSCSVLTSVDLSGFGTISDMYNAFSGCAKLTSVTLPTSMVYTGSVSFSGTFRNCYELTAVDLSGFGNLSNMISTFASCTSLAEVRLGINPNSITNTSNLSNSFQNTPANCIKYLPAGVTDIPQTWKDYYSAGESAYGNFVIPFTATVGDITAPDIIDHGQTLALTEPAVSAITPAYAAADMVWQIAKDEEFTTEVEVVTSSTPISQRKNHYYLRYIVTSPNGTIYATSNVVQISLSQAPIEAFMGETAQFYSISELSIGALASADSIRLYGSWSAEDIHSLKQAIKSSWTNNNSTYNATLKELDFSFITALTNDFSGVAYNSPGFAYTFTNCTALTKVIMPKVAPNSALSFGYAFSGCIALHSVDLGGFDNISDLKGAFENCTSLDTVRLGTNPNSMSNLTTTFHGSSATSLKYLPSGVEDIPQIWKEYYSAGHAGYDNFVIPFAAVVGDIVTPAVIDDGETLALAEPTVSALTPLYAASNVVWQIAKDINFTTYVETITSSTAISQRKHRYYLRYAVISPNGTAYATSNAVQISIAQAQIEAYVGSSVQFYSISELSTGLLASADSIRLYGEWSADNILAFKQAIKSSWTNNNGITNSTLKELDLHYIIALTGDFTGVAYDSPGFSYAFTNCTALTKVIMPDDTIGTTVSFRYAFSNCSNLTAVDLSKFTNISNMSNGFNKCSKLATVSLPAKNLFASGVSFAEVFDGCSNLTTVNLSGFTNISGLSAAFQNCSKLTTIMLPSSNEYTDRVSLFGAFQSCSVLTAVDLSGFGTISDMYNAFSGCAKLTIVTLPTSMVYTGSVSFSGTFRNCYELTTVDLSGFGNMSNMISTFAGCTSLATVRLGANPNSITNASNLSNSFQSTPAACIKYLPAGVTDIPQTWKDYYSAGEIAYGNFVIPFTATVEDITAPAIIEDGETLALIEPTVSAITPAYAAADMVWQIAKDENFTTDVEIVTLSSAISQRKHRYYLRYALISPNHTTYATSNAVQISIAQSQIEVYVGETSKFYSISKLAVGALASADSIVLYGEWSAENIFAFKQAIKSSWIDENKTINSTLKVLDLRYITMLTGDFSGIAYNSPGFASAFTNCIALTQVTMPEVAPSSAVSFHSAFADCSALTTIDLSVFGVISDMSNTFAGCTNLLTVTLPTSNLFDGSVSFANAFKSCTALADIDLNSFGIISDMSNAFAGCSSLTSVTFPSSNEYIGMVSFLGTFSNCSALTTVDLNKFTNISDLRSTFENCTSLDTVRLGTNPNSMSNLTTTFHGNSATCLKYLPDGVDDIPETWQDYYNLGLNAYGNFVIPFTANIGDITRPAVIDDGETLDLIIPTVSDITPAYAAVADVVWQISKDIDFTTDLEVITSSTPISQRKHSYYLRYALINPNNIAYATSNVEQISVAQIQVEAYVGGIAQFYSIPELSVGTLAAVDSIVLYGNWSAEDILAFKQAIKSDWTNNNETNNSTLKELDLSYITSLTGNFTGVDYDSPGFAFAFNNCTALTKVVILDNPLTPAVSFRYTFSGCSELTTVDISNVTNISNMSNAFYRCRKLTNVILPTSNLFDGGVSFGDAFNGCSILSTIDLSGFSKISGMAAAFSSCPSLTSVTLPINNDYTDMVSFFGTFQNCTALSVIDLSGFGTISDMYNAFSGCGKLTTLTLPTNKVYTGTTLFTDTFKNCFELSVVDLSGFGNISHLIETFLGCSSLDTVRLGTDPNSIIAEYLVTTFHDTPANCLKYLPDGVTDIPQIWKDYYNIENNLSYGNFVFPFTVGNIDTPAAEEDNSLSLIAPTLNLPEKYSYAADFNCSDFIWQMAKDENFTTNVEVITSSSVLPYTKNGYYLRCGVERDLDGAIFWSNVVQIEGLKEIYHGSYSLMVAVSASTTVEIKDAEGNSQALSYYIETQSEGSKIYHFTQGVPAATYTIYQDNVLIETVTMNPVPTYTPVAGNHISAPAKDVSVEVGGKLTLTTPTVFKNLLTAVAADQTYKNKFGSLVNLEPITVSDGLVVNLDLTDCNDQWAYMSLPFDLDITTGIRYQTLEDIAAGTETVAVPGIDFYLICYNPASRATYGEGTGNWTDMLNGVIKAGKGFLIAKESAEIYRILALNPNSLDAEDKEIEIELNAAAEGRTGWDSNWNMIGNPFPAEYNYRPKGDAPKFLYRRNEGNWAGGYEINYDAIVGGETLCPYTPYLTQIWSNNTTLTLKVDGSSTSLVAARTQEDRNVFALDLYREDAQIDKVGWIFLPKSSNDLVINEDAIKAGVGENSMWTPFASHNLVYNSLPFEGDRMNFVVYIKAEANSTSYKIKMRSATTEHHDIYIRETNSYTWHDLSLSDYILPAATSKSTRTFEVSIAKNQIVTSLPTQESSSVIVYSNSGNVYVDGVSNEDVVSVFTATGVNVAEYSNSTQHTISNLPLGSYLIRIKTNNGVSTKKVTTVVK